MASNNLQEKAVFTFIWAIENSSVLSIYGARSPTFTVDSLAETRWELSISTCDIIICYIFRKPDMNGPDSIDVDFELSFLNSAGLPLIRKETTSNSRNSSQDGENIHIKIDTGRSAAECWIDCRISLLDKEGKEVHNRRKGWLSSSEDRFSEFQQFYSKNDLLKDKVSFLPNDTLNLRCEFTVYTKPVWSQIEGQKKKKSAWTGRERNASQ
ncbi:hypothetical protein CEXT_144231 [Caerostris extrusa]|uniref:MATH domain-containing protein n=1 Tax=Caerostris extrusa TaxID=172846 RepID=A0AAV4VAI6_CAEEX|nr:hypothetical protein CEXT_144231 [Caerostris extrusa]